MVRNVSCSIVVAIPFVLITISFRNEFKTCPKCRCEIQDVNSLIKLYFGTSANTDELNNEIDTLLDESDVCRKKIDFMLQEMNKNVSFSVS